MRLRGMPSKPVTTTSSGTRTPAPFQRLERAHRHLVVGEDERLGPLASASHSSARRPVHPPPGSSSACAGRLVRQPRSRPRGRPGGSRGTGPRRPATRPGCAHIGEAAQPVVTRPGAGPARTGRPRWRPRYGRGGRGRVLRAGRPASPPGGAARSLRVPRSARSGQHGEAVHPAGHLGHEALRAAFEGGGDQQCVAVAAGRALHAPDDLVRVEHRGVVVLGADRVSASGRRSPGNRGRGRRSNGWRGRGRRRSARSRVRSPPRSPAPGSRRARSRGCGRPGTPWRWTLPSVRRRRTPWGSRSRCGAVHGSDPRLC